MAGLYPDAPGRRMAYDADGTVVLKTSGTSAIPNGPLVEFTAQEKLNVNDEDPSTTASVGIAGNSFGWGIWIFPELREVDGFKGVVGSTEGTAALESSDDTTNGLDGTWTTETSTSGLWDAGTPLDRYRLAIISLAVTAVRGIRVVGRNSGIGASFSGVEAMHVYGTITPGETPDRLLWLDEATGLEFTAPLDVGDVPRGGSQDYEVRLRNNSASFTIQTIQYTAEDNYLGSGDWWTFTAPGGATFQATRQIASLAPATTSGLIIARRITNSDEDLGVHAGRFRASHASLV